jgi:hypothetical protein
MCSSRSEEAAAGEFLTSNWDGKRIGCMHLRAGIFGAVFFSFVVLVNSTAAPFQNLDFEAANTNTVAFDPQLGASVAPIRDLLPGWQVTVSTAQGPPLGFGFTNSLTVLPLNSQIFAAEGNDVMVTTNDPLLGTLPPKTGNYSLFMQAQTATISLSQTGDVPAGATELVLNGAITLARAIPGEFQVSMNGVPLQPDNQLNSDVLHYFVTPFAGKTVTLEVEINGWQVRLDSVAFVPEASPLVIWILSVFASSAFLSKRGRYGAGQAA